MKALLLVGASLLALAGPAAQAQVRTSPGPGTMAEPGRPGEVGRYLVFFGFNSAELGADARRVVAEAAEAYRRGDNPQVTVIGYTDTSGSPQYNQRLSARRAEAVEVELVRQGVPATNVAMLARGEDDLLVPTGEGVNEPQNRRVEILVPEPPPPSPPAPEPEPVVAPPPPPEPEPEPEPDRFTFALGPVYGHNFGETDGEDDKTENDLVGAELTFRALPGFLGGVSLKQMGLWSFNGIDDGLTGRSVASLDFAPDFGIFRPTLAINGGGVYGKGVQDGFVVGPEIRLDVAPFGGFNIGLKAAYDYQFRNEDWDEGILWAGLDLGVRF